MKFKFFLFVLLFISVNAFSQQFSDNFDADRLYQKAADYFKKEKYVMANRFFEKAIVAYGKSKSVNKVNASYYSALCALELQNAHAEKKIADFIINYPESPLANLAKWEMGSFKYHEKAYKDVVFWLNQVEFKKLDQVIQAEYHFYMAYSFYQIEELEKAKLEFSKIKDIKTKYSEAAVYYFAQIAYEQKNYQTALQHFQRLTDDSNFSGIVPYYISQIYYIQRKFDELIAYVPGLLEQENIKRAAEIARILGEAYYQKKQYVEALPYMERFLKEGEKINREDYYLIAYVYYQNKNYQKAAELFGKVTTEDDELNQNTYYHLADSYLKLNDKKKAASAFQMASKYDFDEEIKEEALYNYSKLTFELYYSPFNESIDVLNDYISKYPNTKRTDEAYNYLVTAYMNTKNYKAALESLEKIKTKSHDIKKAYQRVAFYRGLELFNNLNFEEAIEMFNKSLLYPMFDIAIMAQTYYWRGEANYRIGKFDQALADFKQFILSSGSFQLPEYKIAHYGLGYALFKLEKYEEALTWFRKYTAQMNEAKTKEVADAYNRTADCYFLLRKYWVAIDFYDKAIAHAIYDADYAKYQRAFALGLVSRPEKKIETLLSLIAADKKSPFYDDALFELGKTYLEINNNKSAITYYQKIVDEFPSSTFFKKSLVQLGLIYYNTNENEKALAMYKKVVSEFKGSPEAKNALTGIKNIYVDNAKVDDYVKYVESLGDYGTISSSEKDSLTYFAAENVYMKGDCEKSKPMLKSYLDQFKTGNFVVNASFYLADCYQRSKEMDLAIEAYNVVLSKPKSDFTEQALLGAGELNFVKEKYKDALKHYSELENTASLHANLIKARTGILRINYLLKEYASTIEAANKVIATDKVAVELKREARFKKAQSYYHLNKFGLALSDYQLLAEDVKNDQGAESNYRIIEIYFKNNEFKKAEEEIFKFAEKNAPNQYWLAKSFIVLANIYAQDEDYFQAKATLQSVIDGYSNTTDGIIDAANQRLLEIIKLEKDESGLIKTDSTKGKEDLVKTPPLEAIDSSTIIHQTQTEKKDTIIFSKPTN